MPNILLLRARSQNQIDPYEQSLSDAGYNPLCIPVLETVFTNSDKLKRTINPDDGPQEQGLAGVIITSARACEAWGSVVKELVEGTSPSGNNLDWSNVPFYVVGEATSVALSLIGTNYGNGPFIPKDIRGGSQTGNAESLAQFILTDLLNHKGARLLHLTGDKNRDTLPKILKGHFTLQTLQVYETRGSSSFPQDIKSAMESLPDSSEWWIVFFAPSAAEFVTPTLRLLFDLPSLHNAGSTDKQNDRQQVELAAIGPTTYNSLRDKLNLRVAVCSERPTPESLTAGIVRYTQK